MSFHAARVATIYTKGSLTPIISRESDYHPRFNDMAKLRMSEKAHAQRAANGGRVHSGTPRARRREQCMTLSTRMSRDVLMAMGTAMSRQMQRAGQISTTCPVLTD